MRHNSIKILKNQSKEQKVKKIMFLSLFLLGIIFTCTMLYFYLLIETPKYDDIAIEPITSEKSESILYDSSQSNIINDDKSSNSIDQIFSNEHQNHVVSPSIAKNLPKMAEDFTTLNLEKNTNKKENLNNLNDKSPVNNTSKSTKATNIASENKENHRINPPFKVDSIDAILLLEQNMPIAQ